MYLFLLSHPALACPPLQDAAPYFESALVLDPQDMEAAAGLEACRQQLLALKELRRAGQQQQL